MSKNLLRTSEQGLTNQPYIFDFDLESPLDMAGHGQAILHESVRFIDLYSIARIVNAARYV